MTTTQYTAYKLRTECPADAMHIRSVLSPWLLHWKEEQSVFALIFPAFYAFVFSRMPKPMPLPALTVIVVLFTLNTLLYPFSRFMYERVVRFIMGDNVFFVNGLLMLFVKLMTMTLCWAFAIFIAPLGLLYLYIHHTRAEQR